MANFQGKSTVYLQSASLLKDQHQYYNASIQSAYYGCIQFMLYVVFDKIGVTKEKFDADGRNNKDGTHGWAAKLIELEIARKDRKEFKWFQRTFPELKVLRERAAYTDLMSNVDSSNEAFTKADQIIKTLKHLFR